MYLIEIVLCLLLHMQVYCYYYYDNYFSYYYSSSGEVRKHFHHLVVHVGRGETGWTFLELMVCSVQCGVVWCDVMLCCVV